ncbi:porin [Vibrio fluminensis]|uniref:porin n=1 Tax=Vibrio fluminensis TaxID=2783614 RepID=UPI0018879C04|nr:porin [Vibrio fluminensis]
MDKFFKRTLVCAAVASAATVGSANAAVQVVGDAVTFYGQAAGSVIYDIKDDNDNSLMADIESRVGFRGVVDFEDLEPNFVWQMEGGNANNGTNTGGLGARDTYLGFDWEGFGSIKYGRQLVAAYNLVDSHTNPGTGGAFDAMSNDLKTAFQDRADHVIRYDSANWNGFTVSATLSGANETTDAKTLSFAGAYQNDNMLLHAGIYDRGETTEVIGALDGSEYWIVGAYFFLGDFTVNAAYRDASIDQVVGGSIDQESYSAAIQYTIDENWFVKAGYAHQGDTSEPGVDNADTAITARVAYTLPSAILYFDVRDYDYNGDTTDGDYTRLMFGTEYYW